MFKHRNYSQYHMYNVIEYLCHVYKYYLIMFSLPVMKRIMLNP